MDARASRTRRVDPSPHSVDRNPDQARQAIKTGFMRRVLALSVVLAAVALVVAWLWADRPKPVRTAPAASATVQAPNLPRDQQRATTPATPAGPQSSQPLP